MVKYQYIYLSNDALNTFVSLIYWDPVYGELPVYLFS